MKKLHRNNVIIIAIHTTLIALSLVIIISLVYLFRISEKANDIYLSNINSYSQLALDSTLNDGLIFSTLNTMNEQNMIVLEAHQLLTSAVKFTLWIMSVSIVAFWGLVYLRVKLIKVEFQNYLSNKYITKEFVVKSFSTIKTQEISRYLEKSIVLN